MFFSSICFCMFFRPEEDTLFSERFDNARILKRLDIDIGNKDQGIHPLFSDLAVQLTVNLEG
jgi:hypothetical protein